MYMKRVMRRDESLEPTHMFVHRSPEYKQWGSSMLKYYGVTLASFLAVRKC